MADNKKSVLLYCDIIHTVEKLDDKTTGELFKHYLRYVNDLDPKTDNPIVDIVFEPIKQQLKRDLAKWEGALETKSTSGKLGNLKRWHLDIYKRVIAKEITLDEGIILSQTIANYRTPIKSIANIAVIDTVNVTDTVIVKDIKEKKEIDIIFNFRKSLIEYGFKENLVIDWLKVRKTKKATNTETAFKGFIKQVELSKLDINYILEECINNSWKGFKKDWLSNINLTNKTNQIEIKTNFGKTNQI